MATLTYRNISSTEIHQNTQNREKYKSAADRRADATPTRQLLIYLLHITCKTALNFAVTIFLMIQFLGAYFLNLFLKFIHSFIFKVNRAKLFRLHLLGILVQIFRDTR